MITKADIVKLTKKIRRQARRLPDRRLMHPERDWLVALALAGLVLLGGGLAAFWQFTGYLDIDSQVSVDHTSVPVLQQDDLERALEAMRSRNANFEAIQATVPATTTPTIATTSESVPDTEPAEATLPEAATTTEPAADATPVFN